MLSDDEFLRQFERLELDPGLFDHRGHLRLAWLYLQRLPLAEAIERVTTGIRAYANSLGAHDKFRHTMTEAVVRIMAQRMESGRAGTLEDFLAENPDLVKDLPRVLARHYSPERLASEAGRREFLAPDRAPFGS